MEGNGAAGALLRFWAEKVDTDLGAVRRSTLLTIACFGRGDSNVTQGDLFSGFAFTVSVKDVITTRLGVAGGFGIPWIGVPEGASDIYENPNRYVLKIVTIDYFTNNIFEVTYHYCYYCKYLAQNIYRYYGYDLAPSQTNQRSSVITIQIPNSLIEFSLGFASYLWMYETLPCLMPCLSASIPKRIFELLAFKFVSWSNLASNFDSSRYDTVWKTTAL